MASEPAVVNERMCVDFNELTLCIETECFLAVK